jgi:hypothetical protein
MLAMAIKNYIYLQTSISLFMNFVPATTINEVIQRLDTIINDCIQEASRLGYFAILYKEVTVEIKKAITNRFFDDDARMEHLDVEFANRYLMAYDQFTTQQQTTQSWQRTFECAIQKDLCILQHLLLGMNAHINLDLGIAAAVISSPANINDLHSDFQKVNQVIATAYSNVLPRLKSITAAIMMLGDINPSFTNTVINFSIEKARNQAWNNALLMCEAGNDHATTIINTTDQIIAKVAYGIIHPGCPTSAAIKWIKLFESNDITKNLRLFNAQ